MAVNTSQGTTRYGDISPRTAARVVRKMLDHNEPTLILCKMGRTEPQPKNATDSVKFRRPIPFRASTIPLQEGVTPTPDRMAYEDVSVQLKQYGRWTEITDWVDDTHEDPVFSNAGELMSELAMATWEQIVYAAIRGGTNVFYANGTVRTSVNTVVTVAKLRAVTTSLKTNKAKKVTKILARGPDYGSQSVEAAYVAVGHTHLENDFRNLTGFTKVADYANMKPISEHEIGAVEDVRILLSADLDPFADAGGAKGSMRSTSGTLADVYPILIMGQDCFGQVPLKGENAMTPIVVNPKPQGGDPLGQRGSVGFKFATAALILNELWMARLEVACTQKVFNPNDRRRPDADAGMVRGNDQRLRRQDAEERGQRRDRQRRARRSITAGGITPLGSLAATDTVRGFRIGTDGDINVNGETIYYIAYPRRRTEARRKRL
jgi:N4-gp56 family major capsid protein